MFFSLRHFSSLTCVLLAGLAGSVGAQSLQQPAPVWVEVSQAWVRPAVTGQSGTGGYMQLKATQDLTLEGFSKSSAGVPELHEMRMDGDVMRMRAIPSLALPAGQVVALKPGGLHLMLTQLTQPLKIGDAVIVSLQLRTAQGKVVHQTVRMPVQAQTAASSHHGGHSAAQHDHGHAH